MNSTENSIYTKPKSELDKPAASVAKTDYVKTEVPFVNLGLQYKLFRDEIIDKIDELSCSGQYIQGQEVSKFEEGLTKITQTKHCIGVANGTDALLLILKAYGIGVGDEIITVPNSFIASAGAIALTGAKPVFVDVDEDYNIDVTKIEAAINDKTKAILPVHLTGNPADMDTINSIAEKYELKVVEDAAQAIGAQYKDRAVGSLGDAAGFSLHPLKNLHLMGDAGFISTNDTDLNQQLRQLQNHGLINRNESAQWGHNSRLDAIQAGIGNIKLKYFSEINQRFKEIGRYYMSELSSVVNCPIVKPTNEAVFHNFVINTTKREELIKFLLQNGIETKVHYPIPLHLMTCSSDLNYRLGDFPEAERQANEILSLPIYPELTDRQVEWVVTNVKRIFKES